MEKTEIKILHRNPEDYRSSRGVVRKTFCNFDNRLQAFKRELEYKRALNATKMDKIFAKPLVKCLDGHDDAIRSMCLSSKNLTDVYTGSCNGTVIMWNVFQNKLMKKIKAHEGFIRSLCVSNDDKYLFSCGDDSTIKQWCIEKNQDISDIDVKLKGKKKKSYHKNNTNKNRNVYKKRRYNNNNNNDYSDTGQEEAEVEDDDEEDEEEEETEDEEKDEEREWYIAKEETPRRIFMCKSIQNSIDTHYSEPLLISGGETLDLWNYYRNDAIASYNYNSEYIYYVKFNKAETDLVGLTLSDNSIGLVDVRSKMPINKIFLKYRSNSLSWNNMNPKYFTIANEDTNLYTFDMRYLNQVYLMHKGFVNAVLDVDYSPAGNKFVACSYDKTIRLFEFDGTKSYDVYHTKRMQRVLCCKFSMDDKYIYSGSSDMCLRVWRSCASKSEGVKSHREEKAINYRNKLKDKYASLPEIKRIREHHHVPGLVKSLSDKKKIMEQARKRKELNIIKNSKNPEAKPMQEKKKIFVTETSG